MRVLSILLTLTTSFLFSGHLDAQNFHNPLRIPATQDPVSVFTVDVNGDGVPDLLYETEGSATTPTTMAVLLGQSSGGYSAATTIPLPSAAGGCNPVDANRDGKIDLVCFHGIDEFDIEIATLPGNSVTLNATVAEPAGSSAGAPTGTVTFSDGATTLASPITLTAGVATYKATFSAAGFHTLTAWYSGDALHEANSASVNEQVLTSPPSGGATGEWTWMGGSSSDRINCDEFGECGQPGVYGTLGTPAAANFPGGRSGGSTWTDGSGTFWLFDGMGIDANGYGGLLNDVWKFNPATVQWTWMGGSSTMTLISPGNGYGQPGVYGTLDTFAAGDIPGGRWPGTSWTDNGGHLWLFGGLGKDTGNDNGGFLNDLWELNPTTNEWAWMGGSSIPNQPGVYGTSGTPSAGNIPGARWFSTTWTDSSGHLWLFGGGGFDANGNWGSLGDLWEFQPFATASTPTFSLAAGTYTSIQTVTIADSTPGAIIYYTLDGSTPTTASALYSKALTISQTTTINAIAIATGYSNSAVATATYILNLPPSTAPGFTPAAGTYTTVEKVKITDSMKGASIYYTLDGSTPTIASAKYTAAISVNQTTTINAIAVATGYSSSSVASAVYIITIAAAPTFTPTAGEYGQAQWVTLASATPNPTIYYTTDGSTPSESSTQYTGPIAVSATTTIKAIATAIGYTGSPVVSAKFTLVSSPNVLTGLASGIATPAATLNATVHDFDSAGQVWFLWGTNSTALNSSTEKVALPALSGAQSVSAPLTGLAGGTTYYFQPVASTVGGTSYGAIQSFTTN